MAEVGVDQRVMEAVLGRPILGLRDEVEFWHKAGYDYVLVGRNLGLGMFPGVRIGRPIQAVEQGKDRTRIWANEGYGLITDENEFETYPWPGPAKADYGEFEEVARYLPDGMKAIYYGGPIFQWVWMLMGFEAFCFALVENLELVQRLFERVGQIRLQSLERALDVCAEFGAVWQLDDIAYSEGLLVSPQVLREFLFPWFRRIHDVCEARDLPLIYHTDGAFWPVLEDVIDIGFDAIHPIEPKGMGADISGLKRQVGGRLCLIGGVDLDILIRGTDEDVASETKKMMHQAGQDGGYIVGSSNTVTESVSLRNYRAMMDTAREYGSRS
jgi:uroporphyrinogen decarboxylase